MSTGLKTSAMRNSVVTDENLAGTTSPISLFLPVTFSGTINSQLLLQGALTIRRKIPGRIFGNFHGQMVQSFSCVQDDNFSMTSRFKSQV